MLRKSDLFQLIKSLDGGEKRYLVKSGRRESGEATGYVQIIQAVAAADTLSEPEMKDIITRFSSSGKTDVKKHYLFYWILKRLGDYHSARYKEIQDINNLRILMDRSMYAQASRVIPAIKKRLITSENYPDLLAVLELELKISRYLESSNPAALFEEIQVFSKQYADLKTLELIRYRLRRILDSNIFVRNETEKAAIGDLTGAPVLSAPLESPGLLGNYNYHVILFWKYATANDWSRAFPYAHRNYQIMCLNGSQIARFPDETIHSFFNLLTSASISNRKLYNRVLRDFRKSISGRLTSRVKLDSMLFLYLAQLIHFNRNYMLVQKTGFIIEAAGFITKNRSQFSRVLLNNFYFDLAKSFFYQQNYRSSFSALNEIYQNLDITGHTRDFYTHSRILFCLACFENDETEMMLYAAKSAKEFMKRHKVLYSFERRFLRFITGDLFRFSALKPAGKVNSLQRLDSDLKKIFESPFEKTVLNYFDYPFWVRLKLDQARGSRPVFQKI